MHRVTNSGSILQLQTAYLIMLQISLSFLSQHYTRGVVCVSTTSNIYACATPFFDVPVLIVDDASLTHSDIYTGKTQVKSPQNVPKNLEPRKSPVLLRHL